MARRPVVLITGASSGIGAALARVFARNGHDLALVARRKDRLEKLADEIAAAGAKRRPLVIVADLARPDAVEKIGKALALRGTEPHYVVNNAGFGLAGPAASSGLRDQLAMIDVNMRALTALSLAFLPSLARHRGGILNVGSMAGFLPGPGMAVYYASKAYVRSLSDALHRELKRRGVRVTNLAPGPVPTEFGARAGIRSDTAPNLLTQSAEHVAELGYRGLMEGRALVVPGLINRLVIALVRFVPRGLLLAAIDARQSNRQSQRQPRRQLRVRPSKGRKA
jgi:short-subunit dehydrogenase